MLGLLMEKNQQWAKTAWALGFSAGKKTFTPQRRAEPVCACTIRERPPLIWQSQATALGIRTHFMGGFDAQRARTEFHVPDDFEIGAAFAIGYIDEDGDRAGRANPERLEEIVFAADWGSPARL